MPKTIYLNGELLDEEHAAISIDDRGFLLGDGLFETVRYDNQRAAHFKQHWNRLKLGCKILSIPLPISEKGAQQQICALLKQNQLDNDLASVRITITRGPGPRGLVIPKSIQPTLMIQCFPLPEKKQTPIDIMHSNIRINEHSPTRQFKSLSYTDHIIAREQAISAGYDDALLYNTKGQLVSASCANIFLVINNTLFTPPLSSGALPGIMRQHIISNAKQAGIPVHEKNFSQEDCKDVEQAFITNALIQLTPIKQLSDQALQPLKPAYNSLINK